MGIGLRIAATYERAALWGQIVLHRAVARRSALPAIMMVPLRLVALDLSRLRRTYDKLEELFHSVILRTKGTVGMIENSLNLWHGSPTLCLELVRVRVALTSFLSLPLVRR